MASTDAQPSLDLPPFPHYTRTQSAAATKINLFPKCQKLQLWVKFSPQDTSVNCYGTFSHHSSESLVYNLELVGWRDWRGDQKMAQV